MSIALSGSGLHHRLVQLINPILDSLEKTNCAPPSADSTKSIICALLETASQNDGQVLTSFKNSTLALALLITAQTYSTHDSLSWIPGHVSSAAASAFRAISNEYDAVFNRPLVVDLLPEVAPSLKETIKQDDSESATSSARVPVLRVILAAYQFRWFVTQVECPLLGKVSHLVIPCALTALDHWSSEVKGQGMIALIHLLKNVDAIELGAYDAVILDACCQNIPSADEIWHLVVEMSVLVVAIAHKNNCRSSWIERMLNEMLSHLERQPRNKDRRIAWLKFIEPLFSAVLKRIHAVIKLTWIRNTPYIGRLVDELTKLYKQAALRNAREEIRTDITQIFILLQQCKGVQFETAWNKYKADPNLSSLVSSLSERIVPV
ncbi:hypothetical protein KPL70_010667 [Citrus sinensis]|uniref:uncharacterized protein At2g39910 isoform X2 n=1 Tax=Citrus sinensis TaxID=2711 RepID=UPI000D62CD1B|nr:uncharacterized protein At2g39910 isoform X2 [Citrus sinensis]KAH9702137.1 hypothetical protein KPL70_010667 [Citrus sinensis]